VERRPRPWADGSVRSVDIAIEIIGNSILTPCAQTGGMGDFPLQGCVAAPKINDRFPSPSHQRLEFQYNVPEHGRLSIGIIACYTGTTVYLTLH
jgi:hypothetical protein